MESKEKEIKHFILIYDFGPTHAHDKYHAYMGRGAIPKSLWDSYVQSPTGVTIQELDASIVKQKSSNSLS